MLCQFQAPLLCDLLLCYFGIVVVAGAGGLGCYCIVIVFAVITFDSISSSHIVYYISNYLVMIFLD